MKPSWRKAAGWMVWPLAVAILAAIVWNLDLDAQVAAFRGADLLLLALAAATQLLADYVFCAERYRILLGLLGSPMSRRESVIIRGGTLPVRMLMPFRSGELLWMACLRQSHGVPLLRSGLATVLDMGLDVLILLVILGAAMCMELPLAAMAAIAVGVGLAAWGTVRLVRGVPEPEGVASESPFGRARRAIGTMLGWVRRPETRRSFAHATICSAVIEALDLLFYVLVFHAVGIDIPLVRLMVAQPLITFAAGLPVTPLGLGTREASIVLVFSDLASTETLFAAAILASAVGKLLPVAVGVTMLRPALARLEPRNPA